VTHNNGSGEFEVTWRPAFQAPGTAFEHRSYQKVPLMSLPQQNYFLHSPGSKFRAPSHLISQVAER
jgi:hypothetical protein